MKMRQLKMMHSWRHNIQGLRRQRDWRGWVKFAKFEVDATQEPQLALRVEEIVDLHFYCKKVKDDEVVAAVNSRDEALALVMKHIRQKKAKLHVIHQGQRVEFTEQEMMS